MLTRKCRLENSLCCATLKFEVQKLGCAQKFLDRKYWKHYNLLTVIYIFHCKNAMMYQVYAIIYYDCSIISYIQYYFIYIQSYHIIYIYMQSYHVRYSTISVLYIQSLLMCTFATEYIWNPSKFCTILRCCNILLIRRNEHQVEMLA